jgi:hypothetical protein
MESLRSGKLKKGFTKQFINFTRLKCVGTTNCAQRSARFAQGWIK